MMKSQAELEADTALKDALKAIQRARELCERADYGGQILTPLADAHCEVKFAHDTALGRN
jgi:hypothetical protein